MKPGSLLLALTLFCTGAVYAQNVGVGTTTPAAKLDITSTNSGILIPRIALTGTNDVTTVPSPITSMMIYNTTTVTGAYALTPGFYYWTGAAWIRLTDNGSINNIYNSNGSLNGTRTVTMGNDSITFNSTNGNFVYNTSGSGSVGIGSGNTPSGANSTAMGIGTNALSYGEMAVGAYNTPYYPSSTTTWDLEDRLFGIGNGTSPSTTSDALVVMKNGNVGIGASFPGSTLQVMGSTSTTNFQMTNGGAMGYLLQSDLYGNATWVNPDSVAAQNIYNSDGTLTGSRTVTMGPDNIFFNATTGKIITNNDITVHGITVGLGGGPIASNVALGYNALSANVTGFNNTATGYGALRSNTNGSNNVAIGNALGDNTTGNANTAIGSATLALNTTGFNNTAVGNLALNANTTGGYNTALGNYALNADSTGYDNTAVGFGALIDATSAGYNTAVGYGAGENITVGSINTFLGDRSNASSGAITNATAVGALAYVAQNNSMVLGSINGVNGATAGTNVGIGTTTPSTTLQVVGTTSTTQFQMTNGATAGYILQSDASGNATWVAPSGAGTNIYNSDGTLTGPRTVTMGSDNLTFSSTGGKIYTTTDMSVNGATVGRGGGNVAGNIAVGSGALNTNSASGTNNTAVGLDALYSNTTGFGNTAIGNGALTNSTTAAGNSGFGFAALNNTTTGAQNTATGYDALAENTTGSNNTATGNLTLAANKTGSYNTAIGQGALNLDTFGSSNTASGYLALVQNGSGSGNAAYGDSAGYSNKTGSYNAFIGAHSDAAAGNLTNATAIGPYAYVGQSNAMVLGSISGVNGATASTLVGIGTSTPSGTLHVFSGSYPNAIIDGSNSFGTWLELSSQNPGGQIFSLISTGTSNAEGVGKLVLDKSSSYGVSSGNIMTWVYSSGDVGIGTTTPAHSLEVIGEVKADTLMMTAGATAGYILQSDATGKGSWVNPSTLTGTNIYNSDGTLTGPRTVTMGSDNLTFSSTSGKVYTTTDISVNGATVGKGGGSFISNTVVGNGALLNAANTGIFNTAVGYGVLAANTTGVGNTGVGDGALHANTTGYYNIGIGEDALPVNTTGYQNVAIGSFSLSLNTNGNDNTAVGTQALYVNTTGGENTAVGESALSNNTTASFNVALGSFTLGSNTTGSGNTAVGYSTMIENTTGAYNTAVGGLAIASNKTASNNTAIGQEALQYDTSGSSNTAGGYLALLHTNSSDNTAFGDSAGFSNGGGTSNTFLGARSDASSASLTNATAIGANAYVGQSNAMVLGSINGVNGATAGTNVGIGTTTPSTTLQVVGTTSTTQFQMTNGAVGGYFLQSDASGNATWVAPSAMSANIYNVDGILTGSRLVTMGTDNLTFSSTTGQVITTADATIHGLTVGLGGSSVNGNTAIGTNALVSNNPASSFYSTANTAVGFSALYSNTTGYYNTAVGEATLAQNTTGQGNVAVGAEALNSNATGYDNTAVGSAVLKYNTSSENTGVGSAALQYNTSGSANTALGYGTLIGSTTGSGNTATGVNASFSNRTGSYNTAIGLNALYADSLGNYNTSGGNLALYGTSGSDNTAFGDSAGYNNQTGSSNTFLGTRSNVSTGALTNATAIGANAYVAQSNSLVLGAINGVNGSTTSTNVGIGTTSPVSLLQVGGGGIAWSILPGINVAIASGAYMAVSNGTVTTFMGSDNTTYGIAGTGSNNDFVLRTDNTERMRILAGGNVGIGTSAPAYTLDVAGQTRSTQAGGGNASAIIASGGSGTAYAWNVTSAAANQGWWDALAGTTSMNFRAVNDANSSATTWLQVNRGSGVAVTNVCFPTGFVGVGTNAPNAPLHISTGYSTGTTTASLARSYFLESATTTAITDNTNASGNIMVQADGWYWANGGGYVATSDARIKNIIGISDREKDLASLNGIKITDYRYKDEIANGNSLHKKVIAQQLQEVYPQAVKVNPQPEFIPNIYQKASCSISGKVITVSLADEVCDRSDIKTGGNCKFYLYKRSNGAQEEVKGTIVSCDDRQIVIETKEKIDADNYDNRLFVYGTEIHDLLSVDYEAVSMLNVSATQALSRKQTEADSRIQKLEQENAALKAKNEKLQSQNNSIQSDVDKLKASVETLQQILESKAEK